MVARCLLSFFGNPLEIIGERLRPLREERALRQEDLAELAGVGKNTVNRIERNLTEPHMTTIRKLAAALEVEPAASS
jgi:transcriptional regulator with XRE-family HTH domain